MIKMEDNKLNTNDIYNIFENYITNYEESEKIKKEINDSHKKNKLRLKELKELNQENEKLLIKYMTDNNLPGIRKNDFILLCDEKPKLISKKNKTKKIEEIALRNQYEQNPLVKEILDILNQNNIETEKRIKCKRFK